MFSADDSSPMEHVPHHWTEAERLYALNAYGILDTPHEKEFDDIVRLASQILEVPIAAVNLIADHRQWFKSEIGLGVREMPLDDSICKFALLGTDAMIVPDLRNDARFDCNPLVAHDGGLRFYAGELLMTRDGLPLGTLCALDYAPRPGGLSEHQAFALKTLAQQIMSQIELRHAVREQAGALAERTKVEQALVVADQKKDEFLAMLAHELRNPLAPIMSAAQLLSREPANTGVRRASDIIARQAKHMNELIEDLLDVSRVTHGKISLDNALLDMKDLIADAMEQVRPLLEKHRHHVAVRLLDEPAMVVGDRKRLVQVLTNLLSNAAKYTPDAGQIDIDLAKLGDDLVVSLRDNGIGMSPELLQDAFDLFSQDKRGLDRSQGGLGIGLALVKSLVALHGGSVSASSDGPNLGSCFKVILPCAARTDSIDSSSANADEQSHAQSLHIAIVDDNEDAAATLSMCLEVFGHRVLRFHSPVAAARELPGHDLDVCILDIGMPEMDGFALARNLRRHRATADACLIAVTGYGQPADRDAAMAAGFDVLFVKPVDIARLQQYLATLTGRAPSAS